MSIIPFVAVESRARSLVGNRWFVWRSGAAVVRLVWVVSLIVSVLLATGRFVVPVSSHPASSVHGRHSATTATTAIVAREEECEEDECDDYDGESNPSSPGVPSRVTVAIDIGAVRADVSLSDSIQNLVHEHVLHGGWRHCGVFAVELLEWRMWSVAVELTLRAIVLTKRETL